MNQIIDEEIPKALRKTKMRKIPIEIRIRIRKNQVL